MSGPGLRADVWSRDAPLLGADGSPRPRPGVVLARVGETLRIEGPARAFAFTGPDAILDGLCERLGGSDVGSGSRAGEVGAHIDALLDVLVLHGLVDDRRGLERAGGCSGVNMIGRVLDHLDAVNQRLFAADNPLMGLIEGTEPDDVARGWLLESFFYTSQAEWHIEPVLAHPMPAEDRRRWGALFDEERTHWRIYRRLFRELSWDIESRRRMEPLASTRAFIASLRQQAERSELAYAGVLMITEQPPEVDALAKDPLFWSMCLHYRYSEAAIRPLFEHACENGRNGHQELPARVFARHPWIADADAERVLDGVTRTVEALAAWYVDLGRRYRDPTVVRARLSADLRPS